MTLSNEVPFQRRADMAEVLNILRGDAALREKALSRLNPSERIIAERRIFHDTPEPATLKDVGLELSVSPERVRQKQVSAFWKMRNVLAAETLVARVQTNEGTLPDLQEVHIFLLQVSDDTRKRIKTRFSNFKRLLAANDQQVLRVLKGDEAALKEIQENLARFGLKLVQALDETGSSSR